MEDAQLTGGRWIYYSFKPIDRYMPTAEYVWRTALDNIGLKHMELPEIQKSLMDWVVILDPDTLEGKEHELEAELAQQVEYKELRYLNVTAYKGVKADGTLCFDYYMEY